MITIDMNDDPISVFEKPITRKQIIDQSSGITHYDPVYVLIQDQHTKMLEAARTARMLRSSKSGNEGMNTAHVIDRKNTTGLSLVARFTKHTISQPGNG